MSQKTILYILAIIIVGLCAFLAYQLVRRRRTVAVYEARLGLSEEAATRSEQQVIDILDRLPIGIIAVESGTRREVYANDRGRSILKGRQPAKLPLVDEEGALLPHDANPFGGLAAGGEPVTAGIVDGDERNHYIITSTLVDGAGGGEVIYMISDETEKVLTERALERSHRLEAMGTLTRGVAHDLRNLLTPIVGGLDLMGREKTLTATGSRALERAVQASSRAQTLVQRLLGFAGEQKLEPRIVPLKSMVQSASDLFLRKLGPDVETFIVGEIDPSVLIDPNQFELAILNLVNNAADAMPGGGTLRIAVEEDLLSEGEHGLPAGRYARLSVSDSGVGMDEDTRRRAFEPFFTTKPIGTASGLGLPMVDGLVAQSGGAVAIESTPGHGTVVDVRLPIATEETERAIVPVEERPSTRPLRILLVDDEEIVRGVTADLLVEMGHEVVQAGSGTEAISIMRRDASIQAVVADHMMSNMTGGQMAHDIWDFRKVPVLLISGYISADALPRDIPSLAKPFRRAELAQAIDALPVDM